MNKPLHIVPHAEVAERVLLPGDPGRALRIAQQLLDQPRMLNHNRGLWGYTGMAADGELLTVQSTGMGGPSAAIIVEELVMLGARRLIRIGTCGALVDGLGLGDLVVAESALREDGTSRALDGSGGVARADARLTAALSTHAERSGTVASADLFYDPDPSRAGRWAAAGALAVEMEAATVLTMAARHGLAAACILAVTDLLATGERVRIEPEGLAAAEEALGRAAYAALS
jgi:DeoD family purine-nucleoside phosphorylase